MDEPIQYKKRGQALPIAKDDTKAILTMCIDSLKQRRGMPSKYPDTEQGFQDFVNKSICYFEYVDTVNQDESNSMRMIPDIESWCVFLGISRYALMNYTRRNQAWFDMIQGFKDCILSTKKQLAMCFKIPPVVAIFDLTNNHGYVNASEYRLTPSDYKPYDTPLSADELPKLTADETTDDKNITDQGESIYDELTKV